MQLSADLVCGNTRVNKKLTKLDVKGLCGEPLLVDSYYRIEGEIPDEESEINPCREVDQWYYKQGVEQRTFIVEFEKGFVDTVIKGEAKYQ